MVSDKSALSTRVGWIKAEINILLEKSKQALEIYQDQKKKPEALDQCYDDLSEVNKVLTIASIEGGKILSQEMLAVLFAMKKNTLQDADAAMEILAQSFLQLNEYLQHVEAGYVDLPVILLPLINELRAARGDELLSEMFVFIPGGDEINNNHIGISDVHDLDSDLKEAAYKQIRYHFQRTLLDWYRGREVKHSLHTLQRLSQNLIKIHHNINERKLWWATEALIQALEENKLEDGVAVKLLIGNMERHIGQLMFMIDKAKLAKEQSELNRNLIYYIALADKGAKKADRVKDVYMLDIYLPQGDNLERMRQHYSSPGHQLWEAVASSVTDDVDTIINGIQSLALNPAAETIALLVDKGKKVSTTLSMIGMSQLNSIIEKQIKKLVEYQSKPTQLSENIQVDLTTHWLGVKKVLESYAETGKDTTLDVFSDDDSVTVAQDDAIAKVYRSVNEELTQTLNSLDFFEKDGDISNLSSARGSLSSVKSTMVFMANTELSPLVDGVIAYLDEIIISGESAVKSDELVVLADVLMVLESAMSSLQNQEDHTVLLENGYRSLECLSRYSNIDESIREDIAEAREMAAEIKKQMRESKMQTMLAI